MSHADIQGRPGHYLQTFPHIQVDFHTSQRVVDSKVLRKPRFLSYLSIHLPNTRYVLRFCAERARASEGKSVKFTLRKSTFLCDFLLSVKIRKCRYCSGLLGGLYERCMC